jgi:hypothetical protein
VFTQDAVFDARLNGAGIHRGLREIEDWFALGKPPHPPSHNLMNVFVFEEDDEVHVLSKFLTITHVTGQVRSGDYHDVVVLQPNGWRIKSRVASPRFPIPYEVH